MSNTNFKFVYSDINNLSKKKELELIADYFVDISNFTDYLTLIKNNDKLKELEKCIKCNRDSFNTIIKKRNFKTSKSIHKSYEKLLNLVQNKIKNNTIEYQINEIKKIIFENNNSQTENNNQYSENTNIIQTSYKKRNDK